MSPLEGPPDGSAAPLYSVCRFVQVGVETCGVRWRVTQKSGLGARDPGRVVCQAGPEAPAEELGGSSVRSESSSLLGHEGGERASRAPRAPRLRASEPRPGPALSRPALRLAALDPLTPPSASFPQTRHALRAPSAHSALPRVCPPPRLLDQDSEAEEQEGPTRSPKVLSSSGTSRVISRSSPVPGGGSGRPCGRRRAGLPRRARVRAQVPGVGEGCVGGMAGCPPPPRRRWPAFRERLPGS